MLRSTAASRSYSSPWLLQHSSTRLNPDLQDNDGGTALMGAAEQGHEACVKALLRAKANPELLDKNGRTSLHWAARAQRLHDA